MYSLIIVDYNSIDTTIDYINRCRISLGKNGASHVVIVENGNEAGVLESLSQSFGVGQNIKIPQISQEVFRFETDLQTICYCHSGGNIGFARGNDLGAMIARSVWNDEYYIVSNNDLVFEEQLDLSVADRLFSEDPEIGVIGPRVVTPAGKPQSPHRWQGAFQRLIANYWISAFGGLFGSRCQEKLYDRYAYDIVLDAHSGTCAWVAGCFMLLRAEAFHNAGMFDPYTFLYAEEMILSKRMERSGYHVFFCNELQVIHNHAQTTKRSLNALRMTKFDFEANYYFYKTYMHTSPVMLALAKASFCLYSWLLKLKQAIKNNSEMRLPDGKDRRCDRNL